MSVLQRKVRSDLGEGKDGRKTKHVSSMKQRNCVLWVQIWTSMKSDSEAKSWVSIDRIDDYQDQASQEVYRSFAMVALDCHISYSII
jgi:hypothetical protein